MISDILFDATAHIEEYEHSDPAYYHGNQPELSIVLTLMDAMGAVLAIPACEKRGDRIARVIREVDLSAVKAAMESEAA